MSKLISVVCPDCEGTGIFQYVEYMDYEGNREYFEEVCQRCHGEGTILEENFEDEEDE